MKELFNKLMNLKGLSLVVAILLVIIFLPFVMNITFSLLGVAINIAKLLLPFALALVAYLLFVPKQYQDKIARKIGNFSAKI